MNNIFVSYARENITFAERLAKDLQDAGLSVWIDFRKIVGGNAWRDAIFQGVQQTDLMIVCLSPAAVESEWVRREILMARSQEKLIVPVMAVACFDQMPAHDETRYLLDLQIVDFEQFGYEKAFPLLLQALPSLQTVTPADVETVDPASIPNPFKGLEAFQETDAAFFFGRDDLIAKLLDRLEHSPADRFLAVVGASGSGKSSLVRAGLIPAIRAGKLFSSDHWKIAIFTPGPRPTEALARRLLPIIGGDRLLPEIVSILEWRADALHQLTEGLLPEHNPTARLMLVVDQFEEVFTRASEGESAQFLALLHTAVTLEAGRTLVVITMRADFFDRLSAYPQIAALFERENMVIATDMTSDGLRESIDNPAAAVGLVYDHGLTDRILEEVRQHPGSLPLLQFALKELYEQREGRRLTTAAFEAMGGVKGALAQHAEKIYSGLDPTHQTILRRLLLRLIEVSDTGEATRRRVNRGDLTFTGLPQQAVEHVIDQLTAPETRLLVASREIEVEAQSEPMLWVEISHEALTRQWVRLQSWIAEDEAALRLGSELLKAAQDWQKSRRSGDYLLTGSRLDQALLWSKTADVSGVQRDLIEASDTVRQQRTRMRRRVVAGTVVVSLLVTLLMIGLALSATRAAQDALAARATSDANAAVVTSALGISEQRGTNVAEQAETAEANLFNAHWTQGLFLADLSRQQLEKGSPQNALLLALESLDSTYGNYGEYPLESADAMLAALAAPMQETVYMRHQGWVEGAVWSKDERRILSWSNAVFDCAADCTYSVRVWDAQTGNEELTLRHESNIRGVRWNTDESLILSWAFDGSVRVWDAQTGSERLVLRHGNAVNGAIWNRDERLILSWSDDGTTRLWGAERGDVHLTLDHHEGVVSSSMWNGDETLILSTSGDGSVRVWDAVSGVERLFLRHEEGVSGAKWNGDESLILSWSWDDTVRVWDAETGDERLALRHNDGPMGGGVEGVRWNKDESLILSWASDGTVRVWNAETGSERFILTHSAVGGATWNADESLILSWSAGNTARVWDARTGIERLTLRHDGGVAAAAWNADESLILSSSGDGRVRMWDAQTGIERLTLRHEDAVLGARWNADESFVLSWSSDGSARVWAGPSGAARLTLHPNDVWHAAWNRDESLILSRSGEDAIQVWDAQSGVERFTLRHDWTIQGIRWSTDGRLILSWSWDNTARVWDVQTGRERFALRHGNFVNGATWNADESLILSWSSDNTVRVWDGQTGSERLILRLDNEARGAAWNRDESLILTWSTDDSVQVWDAALGAHQLTLRHDDEVRGAAWNKAESLMLTWSYDDTVRVWDARTGDRRLTLRHDSGVYGARWNEDESLILSWAADGTVRVWDARTGEERFRLRHDHEVNGATWNANESLILSWSSDGSARVWDAQSGADRSIMLHDEEVRGAAWNADESLILSWDWNNTGTVRVWNAQTGVRQLTLRHENNIMGAAWNGDGSRILTWSYDDTIRVWDATIEGYISRATRRKTRELDNLQRQQYFLPTLTPSSLMPALSLVPTFTPSMTATTTSAVTTSPAVPLSTP